MSFTFIKEQHEMEGLLPTLLTERNFWGLDTETTGLDFTSDKVILLQIGTEHHQYVIDTRRVSVEPLRPFLESKDIRKICHNANFDYKMIRGSFGICTEAMRDTYLAEKVLNTGRQFRDFGLAPVLKKYLDVNLDKSIRQTFGKGAVTGDFTAEQLEYAALDVVHLRPLLRTMTDRMKADGVFDTWILECDVLPCFADMEFDGIHLDKDKWTEIIEDNEAELKKVTAELNEMASSVVQADLFGEVYVNWDSPDQVLKVLRDMRVMIPEWDRLQKKNVMNLIANTNDKTLKKIKDLPMIKALKKYRHHAIRINTFGYPYLKAVNPVTGKIHPEFEQMGTETGRPANRGDVNLLNIPREKKYRNCFKGGVDEVVETDDYSGCELRIWAEISKDPTLIEAFLSGTDVHCHVGTMMYRKEINKKSPERSTVKAINFGILYGMSAYTLFERLNGDGTPITLKEAEGLYKRYEDQMETGLKFVRSKGNEALKVGFLANISGRRRYWTIPNPSSDKYPDGYHDKKYLGTCAAIAREGGNFLIQSVNADMTKSAMIRLRDHIIKNKVRSKLMNQVYDEIVTRTHKDDSPDFHIAKQRIMKEAAEIYLKTVPMEVEGHVGDSWTK